MDRIDFWLRGLALLALAYVLAAAYDLNRF